MKATIVQLFRRLFGLSSAKAPEVFASQAAIHSVSTHPFFGMNPGVDVEREVDVLRGGRYRDA
jgi:hypothetical protein